MHRAAQRRIIIPFLLPALLLLGVFFLYPLVRTVDISFTEWTRTGDYSYVGVENYGRIFDDPGYLNALKNAFLFTLVGGCMLFPVAIAIAWALNQRIHGERFFRFVVFAPVVLSAAVVDVPSPPGIPGIDQVVAEADALEPRDYGITQSPANEVVYPEIARLLFGEQDAQQTLDRLDEGLRRIHGN